MSQNFFKNGLFELLACNAGPGFWSKFDPFVVGPRFRPVFRASSLRGGGPKFLQICSKNHFFELLAWNAGPDFWSKLIQIEASSLLGVSLGPLCGQNSIALASWGVLGCFLQLCSHTHTQVYAQAVLKVGAPADVSSVGGTPGVWCLNVIGRECWVGVVPCTGSWPGQPPPTKWGKEP